MASNGVPVGDLLGPVPVKRHARCDEEVRFEVQEAIKHCERKAELIREVPLASIATRTKAQMENERLKWREALTPQRLSPATHAASVRNAAQKRSAPVTNAPAGSGSNKRSRPSTPAASGSRGGVGGASLSAPKNAENESPWEKFQRESKAMMPGLGDDDEEEEEEEEGGGGNGRRKKRMGSDKTLWSRTTKEDEREDNERDLVLDEREAEAAAKRAAEAAERKKSAGGRAPGYRYDFTRERKRKTAFVTAYRIRDKGQDLVMKVGKVEYKMARKGGNYQETGAVIQIYGFTRGHDTASVRLDVYGFRPYFFVEMPASWNSRDLGRFMTQLEQDVKYKLDRRMADTGNKTHLEFPRLVLDYTTEQCVENIFRPSGDMVFTAVRIELAYPGLVPEFRRSIERAPQVLREKKVGPLRGLPAHDFNNVTYESDLLFIYRFMCDRRVTGGCYVRVPRPELHVLDVRNPDEGPDASLRCPVDLHAWCRYDAIARLTDDELAVEPRLPDREDDVIVADLAPSRATARKDALKKRRFAVSGDDHRDPAGPPGSEGEEDAAMKDAGDDDGGSSDAAPRPKRRRADDLGNAVSDAASGSGSGSGTGTGTENSATAAEKGKAGEAKEAEEYRGWKGGETGWKDGQGCRRRLRWKTKRCPDTGAFVIPRGVDRSPTEEVVLSWDIEVKGRRRVFPKDGLYPICNVGVTVHSEGRPDDMTYYCFVLRSLPCFTKKGQFVRVYSYESELEMLLDFRRFVQTVDPDVLTGYNVDNFDMTYTIPRIARLAERREPPPAVLGDQEDPEDFWRPCDERFVDSVADAAMMTRDPHEAVRYREQVFSSRAVGKRANVDVMIAGRTQFDMLRYVLTKQLRFNDLGSVGEKYLGTPKEEMPHEQIPINFRTRDGRKKLAFYCMRDAFIAARLLQHLNALTDQGEFANVLHMNLDDQMKRGTTAKCKMLFVEFGLLKETVSVEQLPSNTHVAVVFPESGRAEFRVLTRTRTEEDRKQTEDDGYDGALVFKGKPGFHVVPCTTLDFASLYPSIMMDNNVCYSSFAARATLEGLGFVIDRDFAVMPTGACYLRRHRRHGTSPRLLEKLMAMRKAAKDRMGVFEKQREAMKKDLDRAKAAHAAAFAEAFPKEEVGGVRWRAIVDDLEATLAREGEEATKRRAVVLGAAFLGEAIASGALVDQAGYVRRMDILRLDLLDRFKLAEASYRQITGEGADGPRWKRVMAALGGPRRPEAEIKAILAEALGDVPAFEAFLQRPLGLDERLVVGSTAWEREWSVAKKMYSYYNAKQNAIKVMMNSLYGLLGFSGSFFFHKLSAATVTSEGQKMIKEVARVAVSYFRLHTELLLLPGGNRENPADWIDFKDQNVSRDKYGHHLVHLADGRTVPKSAFPESKVYLDPGIFYRDRYVQGPPPRGPWEPEFASAVRDIPERLAALKEDDVEAREYYLGIQREAAEVLAAFRGEYAEMRREAEARDEAESAAAFERLRALEDAIRAEEGSRNGAASGAMDPAAIAEAHKRIVKRIDEARTAAKKEAEAIHARIAAEIDERKRALLRTDRFWVCECDTEIIYGDTDSVFVLQHGMAKRLLEAMLMGRVMAGFVTRRCFRQSHNKFIKLEWEKTWGKFIAYASKKKYCGVLWKLDSAGIPFKEEKFSGIEIARRDNCTFVPRTMKECYKILFYEEGTAEQLVDRAIRHVHERIRQLRTGQIGWEELTLSGGIKKSVGGARVPLKEGGGFKITESEYDNPNLFSALARKINERMGCEMLMAGARFKAVVVDNKADKMWMRGEDPLHAWENRMPLDIDYYTYVALGKPIMRMFYFLYPERNHREAEDARFLERHVGARIFRGDHMTQFVRQEQTVPEDLAFFVRASRLCAVCRRTLPRNLPPGRDLCAACNTPAVLNREIARLINERDAMELEKTALDMGCRDCVANREDLVVNCINDGCSKLWKQKSLSRRLTKAGETLRVLRKF